jgi:hypothetical protein
MLITITEYRVTDVFCGLIWKGRAIVGLDLDSDAWGVVAGRWYAGWTWA